MPARRTIAAVARCQPRRRPTLARPLRRPAQERFDIGRPAVAESDPDDPGRCPAKRASLPRIIVLGDDQEARAGRKRPNGLVLRRGESELAHVRRAGVEIRESAGELGREVLVDEQPPFPYAAGSAISRRSRSAVSICTRSATPVLVCECLAPRVGAAAWRIHVPRHLTIE